MRWNGVPFVLIGAVVVVPICCLTLLRLRGDLALSGEGDFQTGFPSGPKPK